MTHDPRHQFDCGRCKFSWNCGPKCSCVLTGIPLHLTPRRRILAVAKERRKGGYAPAAEELMEDWEKSKLKLVAEVMEA